MAASATLGSTKVAMHKESCIHAIDRRKFDPLLWLGGSPCAGKSSIANLLSQRYALRVYSADSERSRLLPLIDAERQPMLYKWTHNIDQNAK